MVIILPFLAHYYTTPNFKPKSKITGVRAYNPILVTAIGHAVDFTYLQSIADYNFDTPTALGVS